MLPFGQNWPSSWTTDGTLNGVSLSSGSNTTSSAILNTAASPNEVLDTECDLTYGYPNSAPTGPITVSILRQTQSGYQASTDPNVYSFIFTPVQNVLGQHVVFTIPGGEVGGFKVYLSNGSGFALTTSSLILYYRQSQGQVG